MNIELLQEIGLNPSQAKVYIVLIEKGALTPPQVAEAASEARTNAYMVLEQLEKLELIEKVAEAKKLTYQAKNPVALEKLSEKRRQAVIHAETKVKQAMPALLSYYYNFTEKPGVRFYEGAEAIKEVFRDVLRTKETLYMLRGKKVAASKTVPKEFMDKFIAKRVSLGIRVKSISPDTPDSNHDAEQDKKWLMDRTWIDPELYNDPVEIYAYGPRVAFLSYGEEEFATVIESPQISTAIKNVLEVLSQQLNR